MCIHLTCSPMSIEQMNRWTDGQMDEWKWNEMKMKWIRYILHKFEWLQ
jgi:hypothetical protein